MRQRVLVAALFCAGCLALLTGQALSGDDKHAGHQHGGDEQAMMEMWKKMHQPGEHHAHLKPMAGHWNVTSRWRMSPEQPWDESKGTADFSWIMGGRFLVQKVHNAEMMGEPFEGLGFMGYDALRKQYTSVWIDNMTTSTAMSTGSCDDSGKVLTMIGEGIDPMTGQTKEEKAVHKIINNDKHMFEMYNTGPDGKEFVSLEVVYTRS